VLTVDLDDTTSVLLRFGSGASGYLSTLTATGRLVRVQIFGTKGWLHLLDHHLLERCDIDGRVTRAEFPVVDAERLELEAFAHAISGNKPYPVTAQDAIHGVAVMQAAIQSAASDGERVTVENSGSEPD
jgi:predicted dehydrogenase